LTDGVNLQAIERRYNVNVWRQFGEGLRPFVGLLRRQANRLCLTREGMLVANEIVAVLVQP
jgi:hypothetical protein